MSTKLGTLTLDLVAKIGNFTGPMAQAERQARSSSNNIADSFGIASVAATALGAAVAGISIGGMVAFANQTINTGSEIKKLSQLANTSMHDFQYYAKGAETAGISMESFADKMKDMQDRIGDFQQTGGGPLADFFENIAPKVGVTIQQFQKLSGPDALQLYYSSLQKVNATQNDMKFYMEAIISDSSLLIPLLQNGGEGFKKWGDAAERANAIMSDEMITNLAIAKENIQLLTLQWEGTKNTLINGAMPAIQATIDNMGTLTNTMVIGAAFMAGTYIPTTYGMVTAGYARTKQMVEQTAIQYAAINAERAAAASSLAQAQAQLVNTQSTLAALAAEKALEVQRLQAQINAIGRMASTTRMAQLRQIEVQVTAELTAAETALAAARARSTAAAATSVGVGRAAIGILGGPVGMGITLAAVAAGYLMMKNGADKATSSIDIQGQSVADLVKKYRELNTLQRDNETKALADQVEELSLKYRGASSDLYSFMQALPISDDKLATFAKLNSQLSLGKISSDEYYKAIKSVNILTDDQLTKVRGLVGGYVEAKGKFNAAEVAQGALSTAMSGTTQKAKEQAAQVAGLSEEIKKLLGANAEGANKSNYLKEMVNLKVDPKLAEMLYEARKAEGLEWGKNQVLSDAVRKSVFDRWKADQGLNKTLEERAKIEERNKKAIEAQGAAMKVNALVASNAAKANYAALESAKNLPKGLLSAVNMTESPKSNTAKSDAGARGAFQFMPKTAERFNVDVNSVNSSAKGASEYLKRLLKMFEGNLENALRAYNWGEGNMQNYLKYGSGMNVKKVDGKIQYEKGYFPNKPMPKETRDYSRKVMGYMGGASGQKFDEEYSFNDWLKEQEQFAIEREKREKEMAAKQKEISLNIASEEVRIRSKLADDLNDIKDSGFDDAETKRLIAEYQKRADIDIQIVQASHNDKLSTYSDYLKTEETLTNESFARRQRDLKLDIDFSSKGYIEASLNLEKQRVQEIERLKRTQKLDVLEAKRDWMDKGEYAREYYALIREEILNTASYSPEMKDALIQQASAQQNTEQAGEGDSAISDYKDVMGYEDSPLIKQFEVLDKMRKLDLISEEKYQQDKLQLQAISTASYMEGMFSGFASMVDENSKTYAVLFAAQKAFAVAQAMLNIPAAYSKAYDAVVGTPYIGPYIAPAVGAAAAALQVAQAASIKGVGFADGGFTGYGGKYEVGGVVHKGEGVLTQEEIAALGGPTGFYALRESIKNGFADGGLVLDAPKVLNPNQNKDLTNYLSQAQSNNNQAANVNLNPNFVIVDERQSLGDYLYGPDGKKAFVKFFKQNRRELGFA